MTSTAGVTQAHPCTHTGKQKHTNIQAQTCTHAQTVRREAQIKSSESLSECQLPLGQRLLCVCVQAGVLLFTFHSAHTLSFSHTHILPEPPRLADMLFQTRHTKDNGTRLKRQTSPTFPTFHTVGNREETKQALNDFRWAEAVLKNVKAFKDLLRDWPL